MKLFERIADNRHADSLASRMRRARFAFFKSLLERLPAGAPIRVLDVGGNQSFWEQMGLVAPERVQVVILNLYEDQVTLPNFSAAVGDARNMTLYADKSFDVVFSNSVIEHVGTLEDQAAMAREVRRVGRRYFVQTPNRYFPIEPHFVFPGFQFLPLPIRLTLLRRYKLGWYGPIPDAGEALALVTSIRLLTYSEMQSLFPTATLYCERLAGLTKSFIAYEGWDRL